MPKQYSRNDVNQRLPNIHICVEHDCDTNNDERFPFWMYGLPPHLKDSFLSCTLSNFPQSSQSNKAHVIQSLPHSTLPGMISRLLEQTSSKAYPLALRRDAFLSLKIIVDQHAEAILATDLLSTIFQGALNIQNHKLDTAEASLALGDIYRDSPVIEALDFIHHVSNTFPMTKILEQLSIVHLDYVKSSRPLRRFYGLMTFVVSTGPCITRLFPLAIEVLDEIVKTYHQQCPLVDFAISILVSSWRCRPLIFERCLALGSHLISIFKSSIRRHASALRASDIIWATTSCLGLDALLEFSHAPLVHMKDIVGCLLALIGRLLRGGHDQPIQIIELPLESLGYVAVSTGSSFSPYIKDTMEMLRDLCSSVSLSDCEMLHLTVGGFIGDCIGAVGKEIQPHHAFLVERILAMGGSADPVLRMLASRVLKKLTLECPGTLSPYMSQAIPMLLNTVRRVIPDVYSFREGMLTASEITNAITSFNRLAATGSVLFKFVGAACFLNMSLLGHRKMSVRLQACDSLLDQVLWDHAAPPLRIEGALRHYVAYYIRRLSDGTYINPISRAEPQRSARIEKAMIILQKSPQPLIKVHPTSHAPAECFA